MLRTCVRPASDPSGRVHLPLFELRSRCKEALDRFIGSGSSISFVWQIALFCALWTLFLPALSIAQSITDVEAKPYGSYAGGAIDTVDLATGNLMLNIPIISFPQRGSLPPLSFSIELNNAPYTQTTNWPCPDASCQYLSSRYDTSPPGAAYQPLPAGYSSVINQPQSVPVQGGCDPGMNCFYTADWGRGYYQFQSMGAYLTSSFAGGIATGHLNFITSQAGQPTTPGSYEYSLIDPSGTTHELESDASTPPTSWNTYRTPDGSGYTFIPNNTVTPAGQAYSPSDLENQGEGGTPPTPGDPSVSSTDYWLATANNSGSFLDGVRLGTIQSPTGINYTDTIVPYSILPDNAGYPGVALNETLTPRALMSTETDPSGQNTITRGPWYWSGYWASPSPDNNQPYADIAHFYGESSGPPIYYDSVGRSIPDPIAMQATQYGWTISGGNVSMAWTVPGQAGNNAVTYTIHYGQVSNIPTWAPSPQLDPGTVQTIPDPSTDVIASGWGITSIVLPNGTQWFFTYAGTTTDTYSAGDLVSVTTPSGGQITYQYENMLSDTSGQGFPVGVSRCNAVCHAVKSRTVVDRTDPATGAALTTPWVTTYSYDVHPPATSLTGCPAIGRADAAMNVYAFTTTETDPLGNDTVHTFCGITGQLYQPPIANQYHEILTQYYQGPASSSLLLKSVQTAFESQVDNNPTAATQVVGIVNVLPNQITTTTAYGSAHTSTTEIRQYSNDVGTPLFQAARIGCNVNTSNRASTTCSPGDFPLGTPANWPKINISYLAPTSDTLSAGGATLRQTSTTFEFQTPLSLGYTAANLISLPLSTQISGSNGTGTTTYAYDENNLLPGAFGYLTSTTKNYTLPGRNTSGATSVKTSTGFNTQGMPTTEVDADGYAPGATASQHTTTTTYDTSGLFPQEVQRPTTGTVTHIDLYSYNKYTSELTSHTDENGQITQYHYDPMGRVTSIQYPDTGGSAFCYTDSTLTCTMGDIKGSTPFSLYTSTAADPDPAVVTAHSYDGWGRQYQSKILSDPSAEGDPTTYTATTVDTTYDFAGRVASVSNPYKSTSDSTYGVTSYAYDAFGRKTIQTQPDSTTLQWCYDGIPTAAQSFCPSDAKSTTGFTAITLTDISDESGRHSQQVFDGLGRLGAVMEQPDPTSANLPLETDYTYDVFNDLLSVNQLGASGNPVVRSFGFDIPSRVTRACNPETLAPGQTCATGTLGTTYIYDPNSNLKTKADPRNITTTYSYDLLNRLTSKTYSDGTPASCFSFDTATNGSGRLGSTWTQSGMSCSSPPSGPKSVRTILAYDAMGRLLQDKRCTGARCSQPTYRPMTYTYDLAGNQTGSTDGFTVASARSFTTQFDAAGRLLNFSGGLPSAAVSLFSAQSYGAVGLTGGMLGSQLTMHRNYDNRTRLAGEVVTSPVAAIQAPTTTALIASATSLTTGDRLILTSTVSPSPATGTVTFMDGSTTVGVGTLVSGVTTYSITIATGGHSYTAVYSGDVNYYGSTSSAVTVTASTDGNNGPYIYTLFKEFDQGHALDGTHPATDTVSSVWSDPNNDWTYVQGGYIVSSNSDLVNPTLIDVTHTDYTATFNYSPSDAEVLFRYVDLNNYIYARSFPFGAVGLYSEVGGVSTQLGIIWTSTPYATLTVTLNGVTATLSCTGQSVSGTIPSNLLTGTKVGFFPLSAGFYMRNLTVSP